MTQIITVISVLLCSRTASDWAAQVLLSVKEGIVPQNNVEIKVFYKGSATMAHGKTDTAGKLSLVVTDLALPLNAAELATLEARSLGLASVTCAPDPILFGFGAPVSSYEEDLAIYEIFQGATKPHGLTFAGVESLALLSGSDVLGIGAFLGLIAFLFYLRRGSKKQTFSLWSEVQALLYAKQSKWLVGGIYAFLVWGFVYVSDVALIALGLFMVIHGALLGTLTAARLYTKKPKKT